MDYKLHNGDCLEVMATMEANSIDTIISDPPYGLAFMGKEWDHGVPGVPFWVEALRVAKPGAMLLAFGGTRTVHRLACAIEDAGWEIRDRIQWIYGSGFPKSHNISKAIDKAAGAEREVVGQRDTLTGRDKEANTFMAPPRLMNITAPATDAARAWDGYGTALKPSHEPIIVAMKPLDGTFANNAQVHCVAGLWIDGGRVTIADGATMARNNKPGSNGWKNSSGGPNAAAVNGEPSGRWPANVIHDGSAEVVSGFPANAGACAPASGPKLRKGSESVARGRFNGLQGAPAYHNDSGSAARFFYCAKASRRERNAGLDGMEERQKKTLNDYVNPSEGRTASKSGAPAANHHPTVKPLALMRYLARITRTPTGGTVLDPFMGSGSTGAACMYEGRDFVGIELDADYMEIARRRIEYAQAEAAAEAATPAQLALISD